MVRKSSASCSLLIGFPDSITLSFFVKKMVERSPVERYKGAASGVVAYPLNYLFCKSGILTGSTP